MTYAEELLVLSQLEPRVKRALQRMALAIRASDAQVKTCVDAIVGELMTRQAARTLITGL